MDNMGNIDCDCKVSSDTLHCNICNHVFCGSCQVEFRNTKDCDVNSSPKKSCPKCFSTDLYRKMNVNQKKYSGLF